jgi:hypothetical protein
MQKLNAAVDQQRQSPAQVVRRWRQESGLAVAVHGRVPVHDSDSGPGPGTGTGTP